MINEVDGETCRFCGTQEGFRVFIFDQGSDHIKKIRSILPIEVSDIDPLPKFMCYRCTYKLKESYAFQQQCLKTDAVLRSRLGLPLVFQKGGAVVLSTDWEESVKQRMGSPGHSRPRTTSGSNSSIKNRSGKTKKKSDHKKKFLKDSNNSNIISSVASVGKGDIQNKQIHAESNDRARVAHESSDLHRQDSRQPVKCAVVEVGFSKNSDDQPSAGTIISSACMKMEVPSAMAEGSNTDGVGLPTSSVVKSEAADSTVPANILVTKIPGSCSIYTCQTCERCFVSEEAARKHRCVNWMETQPPGCQNSLADAREYLCEHCNKTFTRYVSLLAHQESHLRGFSDEELEEDPSLLPDNGSTKKQRKRPLSTSSEEEAVPSNA